MASTRCGRWQRGGSSSRRYSGQHAPDQTARSRNSPQNSASRAMSKSLDRCLLYTFIDTAYLHGRDPADVAKQLCDGGSDLLQLRAKQSPIDEVRRLAETIEPIIRRSEAGLVINDHPQLALEVGAPYCHLGQEDFSSFAHVREVLPGSKSLKIGL